MFPQWKRWTTAALAGLFVVSTSACTIDNTAHVATFDTAELSKDAAAASFLVKTLETLPAISSHLTVEQKAQIDKIVSEVTQITSELASQTEGQIAISTGNDWATKLATDVQTVLTIAEPLVEKYASNYAVYVTTAENLVPLIQALMVPHTVSAGASRLSAHEVRSSIYLGAS